MYKATVAIAMFALLIIETIFMAFLVAGVGEVIAQPSVEAVFRTIVAGAITLTIAWAMVTWSVYAIETERR